MTSIDNVIKRFEKDSVIYAITGLTVQTDPIADYDILGISNYNNYDNFRKCRQVLFLDNSVTLYQNHFILVCRWQSRLSWPRSELRVAFRSVHQFL